MNSHADSVANLSGSPIKDGPFVMDPMLEAALDFDTDDDDEDDLNANNRE